MLNKEGILILSTPQKFSLLELVAKIALSKYFIGLTHLVYKEPVLEMGHINLLTEGELDKQLEASGFEIVERDFSGLYLPFLAEFFGVSGWKFAKKMEPFIKDSWLRGILWTQFRICRPQK